MLDSAGSTLVEWGRQQQQQQDKGEIQQIAQMVQEREQEARENIKQEQQKQKVYYDKRHCNPAMFKVGNLVMLQNTKKRTKIGNGLQPNFTGPYKISEICDGCTVKMEPANLGMISSVKSGERVTFGRLKLYTGQLRVSHSSSPSGNQDRSTGSSNASVNETQQVLNSSADDIIHVMDISARPRIYNPPTMQWMHNCRSKLMQFPRPFPQLTWNWGTKCQLSSTQPQPEHILDVYGDGNCLFLSLSLATTGSQHNNMEMRNVLINHLILDPTGFWRQWCRDDGYNDVPDYIQKKRMDQDGEWGTDMEISVFVIISCV